MTDLETVVAKDSGTDSGAVLILAMLFLVVVGLISSALVTFETGGLDSYVTIHSSRMIQYEAAGATDVTIQTIRYSSSYDATSSVSPCSPTTKGQSTNVVSVGAATFVVYCSVTYSPLTSSSFTRTMSLITYQCRTANAACANGTRLVAAQVAFNDYSSIGSYQCVGSDTATCGYAMTISEWVDL